MKKEIRFYNKTRWTWPYIVKKLEKAGYKWGTDVTGYTNQTGDYMVFTSEKAYKLAHETLEYYNQIHPAQPEQA